jgi:hypothetical protein
MWCGQCDAEYLEGLTTCPDCGWPLTPLLPAAASHQFGDGVDPEDAPDTTTYETAGLTDDDRMALTARLASAGIAAEWEHHGDLVVATSDEPRVEAIFDDLGFGGGGPAGGDAAPE